MRKITNFRILLGLILLRFARGSFLLIKLKNENRIHSRIEEDDTKPKQNQKLKQRQGNVKNVYQLSIPLSY